MPQRAQELTALVDGFLGEASAAKIDGEIIGVVVPHAGYAFSGAVAAHSFKQLEGRDILRVVLIGPSHSADLGPQAINKSRFYETPLGLVELDADAVKTLNDRVGINFVRSEREHSLEMQLPFLQRTLGTFKLVPIMMSRPFYIIGIQARNACEELSAALTPLIDDKTILVASSDLSHLHDYDAVTYFDQGFENLIAEYNVGGLIDYMINEGECRACGDVAIITTLMAAKAKGANKVTVLRRTNSGDVTGVQTPGQYTVGYMAAAIYRSN